MEENKCLGVYNSIYYTKPSSAGQVGRGRGALAPITHTPATLSPLGAALVTHNSLLLKSVLLQGLPHQHPTVSHCHGRSSFEKKKSSGSDPEQGRINRTATVLCSVFLLIFVSSHLPSPSSEYTSWYCAQ